MHPSPRRLDGDADGGSLEAHEVPPDAERVPDWLAGQVGQAMAWPDEIAMTMAESLSDSPLPGRAVGRP